MQVNWSKVLTNKDVEGYWKQFVNREVSARQLDNNVYYTYPSVKTLVNRLSVERLRDLARKALLRRS